MSDYAYDPEIAPIVPLLPTLSQWDDLPAQRLAMLDMIRQMSAQGPQPPAEVSWEDRRIPGPAGAPEVTGRLYRLTKQTGTRPAVLYLHGGGFCFGSIETEHVGAAVLCDRVEAVIASVEYRLAPEHPFPAGLEDCYAALQWLHAEAGALEVDPARIAVSGQSAGGGLAAALALLARDRGGPALCFQMLGIPELDDRLETPSMKRFTDTPLWNRPNAVRRPARKTSPVCRRPSSRRWSSTRCATRASSTRCACSSTAWPSSCTSTRAPSTAPRWSATRASASAPTAT